MGGGGGVIWREERSLCPIQELLAEQHNSKPQQIFKDTGTNQKFPNLDWARVINHKRFRSPQGRKKRRFYIIFARNKGVILCGNTSVQFLVVIYSKRKKNLFLIFFSFLRNPPIYPLYIRGRHSAGNEFRRSCFAQQLERDNNCLYYDPIWNCSRFVATTSGLSGVWFSVMYSASSAQPPWFRVNITFHPHKSGVWCRQTPGWCRQTPGLAYTDPRKRHSENSTVYHA